MLLNEVGVLVFVDQNESEFASQRLVRPRLLEELEHHALKTSEVNPIGLDERLAVGLIGLPDGDEERAAGARQRQWIDEFLGDLVEIPTRALDRGPSRLPMSKEEVVLGRADDLVEVLEDEEELGQLVQGLVVVTEWGPMAVFRQDSVAQTVNG